MTSASQPRVCAGCGEEIVGQNYRRNRYREYVCRPCVKKGFRFSSHRRFGVRAKRIAKTVLKVGRRWLLWIGLAVLLLACLYYVIDRVTNPPPPVEAP